MSNLELFHGPNAGYVIDLYERYLNDASAVSEVWQTYFSQVDPSQLTQRSVATTPSRSAPASTNGVSIQAVVGATTLAQSIREYGHLAAETNPLGIEPDIPRDLDSSTHGVTEAELAALPPIVVGGPVAEQSSNALQAIETLRSLYSTTVGYDFDHVHDPAERAWLVEAVESHRFEPSLERSAKRALLRRLTYVEGFERFLHQTYLGQKRFSLEGNDMLVPMLDEIISRSAANGVREIIIGMAHRGRLNVLAHILGKPYSEIVAAFEGARLRSPVVDEDSDTTPDFSGDVKYHLGARLLRDEEGSVVEVPMVLAPNPSHLEAVNPVVEGMVRSSQDVCNQPGAPWRDNKASEAILLHGDAAFPGQGVVAETLNLSALPGYTTGGTIHIIVNNQVGFTTLPNQSRSTLFAGDLAKGFEIPVVRVNADDPVACILAVRMAIEYRTTFRKDFLIDLVGYRRWGHNEGDEPSFTQPTMYRIINAHPTVRELYAEKLVEEETTTEDEPEAMMQAALDHLAGVRRSVTDGTIEIFEKRLTRRKRQEVDTTVPEETLRELDAALHAYPDDFALSAKLSRQWNRRSRVLQKEDGKVDWAHAEGLAIASILSDGIPIRFTGQDAERGTFSQRHLVLHNTETGEDYIPLQNFSASKASFAIYNSPLSEEAAVGFEYGYSVHAPSRLVIWEAQFGDFINGAQVMLDQFIVAARSKWLVHPSLVMLLPHGYEGQGPEHSSGRLERFLQLAAQDNIRVANCTTSAQYFHLLRRQALRLTTEPRPLIIMTPKSLLRNPRAASAFDQFYEGSFKPVLEEPENPERDNGVTRLVMCSGKIAIDLESSPEREESDWLGIARLEQLAAFQVEAVRKVILRYPNLQEIVWVQEEPENMGAWTYVAPRIAKIAGDVPIRFVGRSEQASPATGSAERHAAEQSHIVAEAFANPPEVPAPRKTSDQRSTDGAASDSKSNGTPPNKTAKSKAESRS